VGEEITKNRFRTSFVTCLGRPRTREVCTGNRAVSKKSRELSGERKMLGSESRFRKSTETKVERAQAGGVAEKGLERTVNQKRVSAGR